MLFSKRGEHCKINKKGDRQGMSKAIRHALTITNFTIDRPAPLEINRKIATMGGGAILIVSKNRPLFVQRLSVFLFFRELRKIRPPARKKNGGKLWAGPPILKLETLRHNPTFSVTLTNSQVEESLF